MTPTETAAILRQFNDWRRDFDDKVEQPDSYEIGEAIDAAIEMIERLEAAEKSDAESIAMYRKARGERDELRAAVRHEADCVEAAMAEIQSLRAKIEAMERQEPVGTLHDDGCFVWRETAPHQSNYAGWKMALYALPGAQGEEK